MVGRAVAPGLLKTEFGLSEKQESGGGVEVATHVEVCLLASFIQYNE